ncbi:tyrosine-type recombinase/integrase [Rhodococcus erythropolis]|uniref:tyrosine-type recombinase/integrase n=1 Tax=Rhodococcus erythropolis TaxID=1833 RepID=UPI00406BA839
MSDNNSRKARRSEPITKRTAKNGSTSYTFQIDCGVRADGKRDRRRFTYSTLAEARREFRRISTEVDRGTYVGQTTMTVAECCTAWLESRRDIRANTRSHYAGSLKYAIRELGALKLQALTQRHVDDWVSGLLTHGGRDGGPLAPGTVRHALTMLKMVTAYAARQGLTPRDPAEYVEPPKAKAVNRVSATDIWTPANVCDFLDTAKDDRLYGPFLLSAYGLRRSEVCGLRWSDVDLTRGTVSIEQGMVEVDGKHHAVDEPKTARSRRTLPMPDDVTTALRELRTVQLRESLAVGVAWDEHRHVCSNADGTPVLPRTFTKWFQRLSTKGGLPKITLRNLRHTSVSVMLHDGVPASTVAAWHGHDVRMTTAVYGRTYDDGLRQAAGALTRSSKSA